MGRRLSIWTQMNRAIRNKARRFPNTAALITFLLLVWLVIALPVRGLLTLVRSVRPDLGDTIPHLLPRWHGVVQRRDVARVSGAGAGRHLLLPSQSGWHVVGEPIHHQLVAGDARPTADQKLHLGAGCRHHVDGPNLFLPPPRAEIDTSVVRRTVGPGP